MTAKVDQAFVSDFITQAFGYPIAHEGTAYDPTPGTPYVALRVFANEVSALTVADTDETTGAFQFTLSFPEGEGAMPAKLAADTIFAAYPVGRKLTYSGQVVHITGRHRLEVGAYDGWFRVAGRINYRAFIAR